MASHLTGTREEWLAARINLLKAEKEHTRRGDELARERQELPWVVVEKDYRFQTENGEASLADLFNGNSQLLVYHLMFSPEYSAGACPVCTTIADGFNGSAVHLANHDVTLMAISRAPLDALLAYKQRMGWTFPWASSFESDFNYDYAVSFTEEQQRTGEGDYNFRERQPAPENPEPNPFVDQIAAMTGTDAATYTREAPGMSAFILEDGVVYHTYSAYARGVDAIWGLYPWLDRAPKGRNESGPWFRRKDEYAQH
jgi:predicted dithiol-disulfide oxidoreductase (DUF899 family)